MKPGELLFGEGDILLNEGRPTLYVTVENRSSHTIFVSSQYPFFEVNRRLVLDRRRAWGMHLDIPAGDSVRWRPGETKVVRLVAYDGRRVIRGFNGLTGGVASPRRLEEGLNRALEAGFEHRVEGEGKGRG